MSKSTFSSSLMAVILLVALVPLHSVTTAEGFDWAALVTAEEAAAQAAENETAQEAAEAPKKKSGNGFARALGAPFRALGCLFGGCNSKKKSEQSATRKVSEKEAAKFETAKIIRVKDARSDDSSSTPPAVVLNQPVDVHLQKGRELLNAGNLNEAIAELTAAQSVDPKSAEIQNLLGVAYASKGMTDRALKAFETAIRTDKDNAQYLNNYGFFLLKTSNFESAVKHLKRAAKLSPNDARIWNNLAVAQCQRGKFDEAYESFVRAVGEYDARVNMSAQLLAQGRGQEAIKHLEIAYTLRPESTEVLTRLAGLYRMTGRTTEAETARRNLLALQTSAAAQK